MPRYDYRCEAGHKYELQQPFGSPTEHECNKCGKPARRIVTVAPPLIFKAGGYYKTSGRDFAADSASGGSSSSTSSDSKSSSRSSKSESSKSTSEPKATKSSTKSKGKSASAAD